MKSVLAVAAIVALPSIARADVASFRAEVHGGAGFGGGISGDHADDAFFANAPLAGYGVLAGVEVLFLDAWIQHHQYTTGSRLATWTQFSTGLDIQIPIGAEGAPDADGKRAPSNTYLELGMSAGFGLGTGAQVDPPLDYSEITDKGFVLEGVVAVGHHFGRFFDLGVRAPVGGGYFFKSGPGATSNDLSTHYTGWQAAVMLYARLQLVIY